MALIIVDVDGTVADIRERLKAAGKEPGRESPAEFQAWLDRVQNEETLRADLPVPGMREVLMSLAAYNPLVYVTGRAERYRQVTKDWLNAHGFPFGEIVMRANGDERTAAEYKEEAMQKMASYWQSVVVLDDDGAGDCSAMYTRNGWTHLQVKV